MNIALLNCEKFPGLFAADQFLIPELATYNISAKATIWNDTAINWNDFEYLIFRNIWDYYEKETEFNRWLDAIEKLGIKTLNTLETIKQNKNKFYLRELEKKGISIVPTVFIDKTDSLQLMHILPPNWKKAVIKPAFSAGSYLTETFKTDDLTTINVHYQAIAAEKQLLLQEFMPQIQVSGETSFIFFNKKFSHCINKKPAEVDLRVQIQFGGTYTLIFPRQTLINQAQKIVDTFPDPLLYARVDGIVIDGQILLMEVDASNPISIST